MEVLAAAESEEEEEEEESEYETDSDDEQIGRQMLKPVFVTKKERETIAEREALEREELEAMKKEKVFAAAPALITDISSYMRAPCSRWTLSSVLQREFVAPEVKVVCLVALYTESSKLKGWNMIFVTWVSC